MSPPRVQALVVSDRRILMVQHNQNGASWWCLPGGGLEPGETPEEGALRELQEECNVTGAAIRQISHVCYAPGDETITFLVDIGDQRPTLGHDPEFADDGQILVDARWLTLDQIPERDRVFLWAAGLLAAEGFLLEIESWGTELSYPRR